MNAPVRIATLTHAGVVDAIDKMMPGQLLVYHVGSLMHDRLRGPMFQTVHGAGLAAYSAYERGEVILVQHKLAPLQFEYIAIKQSPRTPTKVLGSKVGRDQPARRPSSSPAPVVVEGAEAGAR